MALSNLVTSSFVLSLSVGLFGVACTGSVEDPAAPDSEDTCEVAEEAEALASFEPLAVSDVGEFDRGRRDYRRCIDRCEDRLRDCRRGRTDRERDRRCRGRYDNCRDECRRRHGGGRP